MNIILRKLQDTDKATYFALAKETWVNKKALWSRLDCILCARRIM